MAELQNLDSLKWAGGKFDRHRRGRPPIELTVRRQLWAIGYRLSLILRLRQRHSQYLGDVQRPAIGVL
jgi:hypothetical protein